LIQAERKVEALRVIISTSVFDREGVAFEPLYWILLHVVLGDPQRFEFFREKLVANPCREGGEAVVVAFRGGLLASLFFNFLAGVEAAT
jgi:hypothetical protein